MSDALKEALGIEDSPLQRDALALVEADTQFVRKLIDVRRRKGMSRATVAERMGVPEQTVREFEAYWYDPRLSELRRYALAVGQVYSHRAKKGESA
jgi:DNA-binding XRE family transcriptional regulator